MIRLQTLFTTPASKKVSADPYLIFWFVCSLAVAAYFGLISLQYAFSNDYVVQDDARQHVFWMARLIDPQLFPNDPIADYFQSVAPVGYVTFYRLMAQVGVEPAVLAKILPLVLGLITSVYCFGACLQMFPAPAGAFLATLLLNQSLWLKDDISSATARAFLYPLFLGFLYYLLRGALIPCLIAIALQGLFYPQLMLVEVAVLTVRLGRWQRGRLRLSPDRRDYIIWGAGLTISLVMLLLFARQTAEVGPLYTAAQARAMLEFGPGGRVRYFLQNPLEFWLFGDGGIQPPFLPPLTIWFGLALPFLLRRSSSLSQLVSPKIKLLVETLVASFGLFFLAHLFFQRLHLPNRYTGHSLRVVLAIASGFALLLLLEAGMQWFIRRQQAKTPLSRRQRLALGLLGLFGSVVLILPTVPPLFLMAQIQIVGQVPQLYKFFSQQPQDIRIASLAEEVNNLPAFTQRSILVGREYAIPLHARYYDQFRQRTIDLIIAEYSSDLEQVQSFIQKYGVSHFLLDRGTFTPEYLNQKPWLQYFQPATSEAIARLQRGEVPVLSKLGERCSALETETLVVLAAKCISVQSGL